MASSTSWRAREAEAVGEEEEEDGGDGDDGDDGDGIDAAAAGSGIGRRRRQCGAFGTTLVTGALAVAAGAVVSSLCNEIAREAARKVGMAQVSEGGKKLA